MEQVIGSVRVYHGRFHEEITGQRIVIVALYRIDQGGRFLRSDEEIGSVQRDDLFMIALLMRGKDERERPAPEVYSASDDELEATGEVMEPEKSP